MKFNLCEKTTNPNRLTFESKLRIGQNKTILFIITLVLSTAKIRRVIINTNDYLEQENVSIEHTRQCLDHKLLV